MSMRFGESTSGKSLDLECESHWSLSVVPGGGTKVWGVYMGGLGG
jgi:hypothetical protein